MLARYAGSTLGLFAFAIVIIAGLYMQNPVMTTLSRSLFALFSFFVIGFLLGSAAQLVVNEHRTRANADLERKYQAARDASRGDGIAPVSSHSESSVLET